MDISLEHNGDPEHDRLIQIIGKLINVNEELRADKKQLLEDLKKVADDSTCVVCRYEIESAGRRKTCEEYGYDCAICADKGCPCKECKRASNFEWRGVVYGEN